MSENLNNQRYPKKIESEICLDEIMINQNYFSKNHPSKNPSNNNNLINNNCNNNIIQTNILLNSIQDFFNRYEKDDRKILSNKKFIISFQELISLIKDAIIAQQQIDDKIYNNNNNNKSNLNIQRISQKYINDLSYNIFSFDKIDLTYDLNVKKKKKYYSNISPNIMKFQNNSKIKKTDNSQSISPNNIKKEINSIFENIYKEVFLNGNNSLDNLNEKNIKMKKKHKSKTKNIIYERNKSAIISKKNISPLRYHKISKNKNENNRLNKTIITNNISNSISYNNNNININNNYNSHYKNNNSYSADKIKILKSETNKKKKLNNSKIFNNNKNKNKKCNKNELKCSDIFIACENINMIKNSGNKKLLSKSTNLFSNNLNNMNNNENFLKKSLKSIGFSDIYNNNNYSDIIRYEELNLNNGVKKIIVSNTHKPSNLANKLLISGHKYIEDFKEMNQGSKKKNI